ncbi:MAG: sporulation protein YqfD [Firmicutes bacterium]|nr:sporulation protein YqfD [Bacillota bacterium]
MIARRLSAFSQGYLVAMVKGPRSEELINRGLAAGVVFWDIKRKAPGIILFKVYARQYPLLRPFFFRTRTKGKILRRKGWPFFRQRVWRKKGWLLGMALFLLLLKSLSSFIWFIQVEGVEQIEPSRVLRELSALGLSPGVSRREIQGKRDWLIRELRIRLPEVVWITIGLKGVVAEVTIAEKTLPPPVKESSYLLAGKDGLITRLLVLGGTPLVREGDTVARGDLLILGETRLVHLDGSVETKMVKAAGEVWARVWYELEIEEPLTVLEPKVTGGQRVVYSLRLGRRLLSFFARGQAGDLVRQERAVKTILPGRNGPGLVELIKDTYQTVEWTAVKIPPDVALAKAEKKGQERIGLTLPPGVQPKTLRKSWIVEGEVLTYRLLIETEENIAVSE